MLFHFYSCFPLYCNYTWKTNFTANELLVQISVFYIKSGYENNRGRETSACAFSIPSLKEWRTRKIETFGSEIKYPRKKSSAAKIENAIKQRKLTLMAKRSFVSDKSWFNIKGKNCHNSYVKNDLLNWSRALFVLSWVQWTYLSKVLF